MISALRYSTSSGMSDSLMVLIRRAPTCNVVAGCKGLLWWITDIFKLAWKTNRIGIIFNHSICKVWVVTSYITSADGPDDVHKTFSLPTISDNHRLACKVELSLSSQSGQQSMPGTEYDSAINVHIHVCCSRVPGHASSYVPGMSVAYENQGLVR